MDDISEENSFVFDEKLNSDKDSELSSNCLDYSSYYSCSETSSDEDMSFP